jgi:hypothetical protein
MPTALARVQLLWILTFYEMRQTVVTLNLNFAVGRRRLGGCGSGLRGAARP